jgi:hypothetical protein
VYDVFPYEKSKRFVVRHGEVHTGRSATAGSREAGVR